MASAQLGPGSAYADVSERGFRLLLIVIGVMAASLMQTLDSTIVNVALPNIQGNLGAGQDQATWIVTSYIIAAIIVIPITPWLQNRFGRKNYYVASIVGFTLASVMCGVATDLNFLIMWRFIQGLFGGGLLATGQSVLRDTFPPNKLGVSQGIFALGAILGPALGPPLGGILVDNASWNWVFDINVGPGILSALLMFTLLRDPVKARKAAVDFIGLVLLAVGLGTMQYVLTEGERNYWFSDATIVVATVICVASLVAFVLWELFGTEKPIVDLHVLRNRSVSAGTLLALALGMVIFGSTYTLPQVTQGPLGFTPTLSGELFIIRAIPIALFTPLMVRLVARFDPRYFLAGGFVLLAAGTGIQALVTTDQSGFWTFALALVLVGAGAAMLFVPLTIAVLGATTPQEGPKASAFTTLALQLGGSVAIAALDVLIDRRWSFHSAILGAAITRSSPTVQQYLQHGSVAGLAGIVNLQAAILAYADATFVIAVVAALFMPLVFFMRKPKKRGAAPAEAAG
ncbi:MAG: DHA2 family efflux MFS transporter permease subunit [Candidatus Eremiobacteraeota bacterium]|nr:DHA2 family efflux MFS transporter permease subunit [Candidatus Eremiobacteraeota bacterium]